MYGQKEITPEEEPALWEEELSSSAAPPEPPEELPAPVTGKEAEPLPPTVEEPPRPKPEEPPQKQKKEKQPPDLSVMKVRSFMGALILLAIPIVNLVLAIQWTFSRHINRNKRNLGIAALLLMILFTAIMVGVCLFFQSQFQYSIPAHLWAHITGNPIK